LQWWIERRSSISWPAAHSYPRDAEGKSTAINLLPGRMMPLLLGGPRDLARAAPALKRTRTSVVRVFHQLTVAWGLHTARAYGLSFPLVDDADGRAVESFGIRRPASETEEMEPEPVSTQRAQGRRALGSATAGPVRHHAQRRDFPQRARVPMIARALTRTASFRNCSVSSDRRQVHPFVRVMPPLPAARLRGGSWNGNDNSWEFLSPIGRE
jgi:hypothetical protein